MKARREGFSLVEAIVVIGIVGLIGLAAASFFSNSVKLVKDTEKLLTFEQAADLIRTSLTDKSICNIDFWNYGGSATGTRAVANDHLNVTAPNPPAAFVPGFQSPDTAYATIDAIRTKPDPTTGSFGVVLRENTQIGENQIITEINLHPVDPVAKFVKQISPGYYVELVQLEIKSRELTPEPKERSFTFITAVKFNSVDGEIDACYRAAPLIRSFSATRSGYPLSSQTVPAGPKACNKLSLLPSDLRIPAPVSGPQLLSYYQLWCEHYGNPGTAGFSSMPGWSNDPYCLRVANPRFTRNSSYIKNFKKHVPKTDPRPTEPITAQQGRCWLDYTALSGTPTTDILTISPTFDADPSRLALGCRESNNWYITSCTVSSDGKSGALSVAVELDPADQNHYCVFKKFNANETGYVTGATSINVVCSQVSQ